VQPKTSHFPSTQLKMTTVPPDSGNCVGIVGRNFISVLTAKISALAGYNTWLLCPAGQEDVILSLIDENMESPSNLELIAGTDTELIESRLMSTDAIVFAVDGDDPMNDDVINFFLDKERATNLKRVVAMSRNLNGKDMGFFVKASKISANGDVWDNSKKEDYEKYESLVKNQSAACEAEYTIVRAGTLKGGGCGDNEYSQYLAKKFYEVTKKDIVTWNLLFDCNVRGVKLAKGDVLPGAGNKAIFSATGIKESPGDTSRCGIAEAMIRSLNFENVGDTDFGVATAESRTPPTDDEWKELFSRI